MILRGLSAAGRDDLAHEIAVNHLDNVVEVFRRTGTIWENLAPETASPGTPAKKDFVGWGGLGPVAVLLEYVFGLRPDVPRNKLVWDVRLLDEHGVRKYPFGTDGSLDLASARRSRLTEKPAVSVRSNRPLTLELHWTGGTETRQVEGDA
jgi:hypothetical protein